jgi:hypothetical protein
VGVAPAGGLWTSISGGFSIQMYRVPSLLAGLEVDDAAVVGNSGIDALVDLALLQELFSVQGVECA